MGEGKYELEYSNGSDVIQKVRNYGSCSEYSCSGECTVYCQSTCYGCRGTCEGCDGCSGCGSCDYGCSGSCNNTCQGLCTGNGSKLFISIDGVIKSAKIYTGLSNIIKQSNTQYLLME